VGALGSRLDREQLAALEADHPWVSMAGDVDFSALTYERRTDPAEWLAGRGWDVEPVRNTLELQARYGMTPPEVDAKIDGFMQSQYITAIRF
jgi:O-methyltransferase involved in polyketide biosynthesis